MKRDMDLVRVILMRVEERTKTKMRDLLPDPDDEEERQRYSYHIKMLVDERLLDGRAFSSMKNTDWSDLELRWPGHEFLNTLRDPSVWEKTKEVSRKAGGGGLQVMLEIGRTIIVEAAKEQLKKIGVG